MHCPHCGQQPPTEQTRYCTHCGFALSGLKDFMTTGLLPGSPRQRDITLGAGLVLIGVIKSILLSVSFGVGRGDALLLYSFGAAAFFGVLQLFFQLSPRQKGLSLGATLMFISALVGGLLGVSTEGVGLLAVLIIAIPIILFWQRLAAGFLKLFFDKTDSTTPRVLPQPKIVAAFPPEQSPAVATNQIKQQISPEPVSIIEGTTKTLNFTGINEP